MAVPCRAGPALIVQHCVGAADSGHAWKRCGYRTGRVALTMHLQHNTTYNSSTRLGGKENPEQDWTGEAALVQRGERANALPAICQLSRSFRLYPSGSVPSKRIL